MQGRDYRTPMFEFLGEAEILLKARRPLSSRLTFRLSAAEEIVARDTSRKYSLLRLFLD